MIDEESNKLYQEKLNATGDAISALKRGDVQSFYEHEKKSVELADKYAKLRESLKNCKML